MVGGVKIPLQDFAQKMQGDYAQGGAYLQDTTVLQPWFTVMFKASNRPLDAHNQVNSLHTICCHSKSMDIVTFSIKFMCHKWMEVCQ